MEHYILLVLTLLALVSDGSCVKKRLFFGDYSSSESSESNSTESDDWLESLQFIWGPFSTTSKRPAIAGTKIPITTTTLRPPIIKCSDKPSEPCPTDCLTDSAIIHGFCCNCKHPTDPKVKPNYLCPASTACPANTTKLCDLFSRLMTCCCKDAFSPKPTPTPPSKPVQTPPGKPLPTPPMIPSPTSQKPSSTDPWPTPPSKPLPTPTPPPPTSATALPTPTPAPPTSATALPTSTSPLPTSATPLPSSTTAPLPSSTTTPLTTSVTTPLSTAATAPLPPSEPNPANPLPTPPTSSPTSPGPLPTPPTVTPTATPPSKDSPTSGKSQQHHIVVDIDSGSLQDEVVDLDLPFENYYARRFPRTLQHIKGF